jgi:ATP/ADP translocase
LPAFLFDEDPICFFLFAVLDHFNVLCDEKALKRQVLIVLIERNFFDLLVLDRWNHRFLYVITFVFGEVVFPLHFHYIHTYAACQTSGNIGLISGMMINN